MVLPFAQMPCLVPEELLLPAVVVSEASVDLDVDGLRESVEPNSAVVHDEIDKLTCEALNTSTMLGRVSVDRSGSESVTSETPADRNSSLDVEEITATGGDVAPRASRMARSPGNCRTTTGADGVPVKVLCKVLVKV